MITVSVLLAVIISAYPQLGETVKSQLVKDWERAKAYTIEYLDAMPADKYGFKASVRSFVQQMLHLAQGTIGLSSNGTGKERIWQGQNIEARTSAQSADSVRYFVTASYDFAIDELSGFIHAAALIRPSRYEGMDFKSIHKKLKTPSFAAQVNRDDIEDALSRIDTSLQELVEFIIEQQQRIA